MASSTHNITVRAATESDIDDLVGILSIGFLEEPMGIRTGVTLQRLEAFASRFLQYGINGLTAIALVDNVPCAAILNIINDDIPQSEEANEAIYAGFTNSDDYGPILAILDDLNKLYTFPKQHPKVVHAWMASCLKEYRKLGLLSMLVEYTKNESKRTGFDYIIAEATGIYSLKASLASLSDQTFCPIQS